MSDRKMQEFEEALSEYRDAVFADATWEENAPTLKTEKARSEVLALYREALEDSALLEFASRHFVGVEFDSASVGEDKTALIIEIPDTVRVGVSLRAAIDAAMSAPLQEKPTDG